MLLEDSGGRLEGDLLSHTDICCQVQVLMYDGVWRKSRGHTCSRCWQVSTGGSTRQLWSPFAGGVEPSHLVSVVTIGRC